MLVFIIPETAKNISNNMVFGKESWVGIVNQR
jgi:hypothetical protein